MLGSMTHSLTVRGWLKSLSRTLPQALFLSIFLLLAAACGNKGALYLPDESMPAQASTATDDEGEDDNDAGKDDGDG